MRRKVTFAVCEEGVEAAAVRACADATATLPPRNTVRANAATNLFILIMMAELGARFAPAKTFAAALRPQVGAPVKRECASPLRPAHQIVRETARSANGTKPPPARPRRPMAQEFPPIPARIAPSTAVAACPHGRSLPPT